MRHRNKTLAMLITAFLIIASAQPVFSNQADFGWQTIGDTDSIKLIENNSASLNTKETITAGLISSAFRLSKRADALLIEATVTAAAARAVTFAVHDAKTGNTLGYWQNPVAIETPTKISAVLNLSKKNTRIRIFAGTHNQPSTAAITDIKYQPLRLAADHHGSVYGALIDDSHIQRQTFRANGKKFGAAVFRIRELGGSTPGPDLRVRLYEWADNLAATIAKPPLAETIVARNQIPGSEPKPDVDLDISATYSNGARELAVPLNATTELGKTYMVELAVTGKCEDGQKLLTYGYVDGYRGGQLYENNNAKNWDLYFEVYNSLR